MKFSQPFLLPLVAIGWTLAGLTIICLVALPAQMWNFQAIRATCERHGETTKMWCHGGDLCYEAWLVTSLTGLTCGTREYMGQFGSKSNALRYLHSFESNATACYYNARQLCAPSLTLKSDTPWLVAGLVFIAIGFIFMCVAIVYHQKYWSDADK